MKAPAATEVTTSALDTRIFAYPKRTASACAEVLARLLNGEVLTGMDAVFEASTTRLSAHTHYLGGRYNWPIEAEARAVGCADGRLSIVAAYKLPADCIHAARAAGAGRWTAEVKAARAALRAKAADAQRRAAAMNKARKRSASHPGQGDLFQGGAA